MSGTAEIDVLERGELRGTLRTVGYEGRLAGQIRPSGRVHGAVYVPDQQLTLMVDGPFEVGTTSGAVATLEVFLRRLDIAQVRVELARRADVARGD